MLMFILLCGCTPQFALFNIPSQAQTTARSTEKATRNQCQECAKQAADAENKSYKKSVAEMKAAHEREQKRIKAQYDACSVGEAVEIPPTTPAGELLPETGTVKDAPYCHDRNCK